MSLLTRLAKIADELDRAGRHTDADAITYFLTREAQWNMMNQVNNQQNQPSYGQSNSTNPYGYNQGQQYPPSQQNGYGQQSYPSQNEYNQNYSQYSQPNPFDYQNGLQSNGYNQQQSSQSNINQTTQSYPQYSGYGQAQVNEPYGQNQQTSQLTGDESRTIQETLAIASAQTNGMGWSVINDALANNNLSDAAKSQLKQQFAIIAQQKQQSPK